MYQKQCIYVKGICELETTVTFRFVIFHDLLKQNISGSLKLKRSLLFITSRKASA